MKESEEDLLIELNSFLIILLPLFSNAQLSQSDKLCIT